LTGLVTDPAGAAIADVTVKFTFSQLPWASLNASGGSRRFQILPAADINLIAGQSAALNFGMQIGALNQQVEIAATVVQVDTRTANESVTLTRDMASIFPRTYGIRSRLSTPRPELRHPRPVFRNPWRIRIKIGLA